MVTAVSPYAQPANLRHLSEPVVQSHGESEIHARLREAEGAQTLLLEIIRRAAQDWVLYRDSKRADQRELADEAFVWLFVEDEDHPHWQLRIENDTQFTSFLSICDSLNLDPDWVRSHVRRLTPEKIKSLGRRPSTTAKRPIVEESASEFSISLDYDALILSMLPTMPGEYDD